ncbi:hypothetical protein GWC95_11445 [Sediminibacterium roseum]|uniref:Uncharacterized protein n=1 Tax=Sediminibacterium roseum TaxID=1978412 RepID=A0ABX0A060_9BACT|nr:hypothetical protein [Sediminibacterium roseum]NCI50541.1 hypothetical protein [Sediminibacterium roseum]
MNSHINTYNDLLEEKKRLKLLLEERKIKVQTEFEEIKVKLKPVGAIIDTVQKMTTKDKSNPLLNMGIDVGVNLILKKLLLRNAGFIMKLLVPMLAKNYLSHEVEEDNNIFSKVGKFFRKTFRHQQA